MTKIIVREFLDSYVTNDDGDKLRLEILKNFKAGNSVSVSFEGISGLNTSFINTAFIELMRDYPFDYIVKNLRFVNSTKSINRTILSRFDFEKDKW